MTHAKLCDPLRPGCQRNERISKILITDYVVVNVSLYSKIKPVAVNDFVR